MPDYLETLREDRRLSLLQILDVAPDYTAHGHLLSKALEHHGHRISFDVLRGDLAWLDEQGLIILANSEIPVATLIQRGEDVARGLARVPGVARKLPGGFMGDD